MSTSPIKNFADNCLEAVKNRGLVILELGVKLSNLDGLGKVASLVKPLIKLIGLNFNLAVPKINFIDDLDALKSLKKSISWIKTCDDFFKKAFDGGFLNTIVRVLYIVVSFLNLNVFLDKIGLKSFLWISPPIGGLSVSVGNIPFQIVKEGGILSASMAIETVANLFELLANALSLYVHYDKTSKIEAKMMPAAFAEMDAVNAKYQKKYENRTILLVDYCEKHQLLLNKPPIVIEGSDDIKLGDLGRIRKEVLEKKIYMMIGLFSHERVSKNWKGIRCELISKNLEKAIKLISAANGDEAVCASIDQILIDCSALMHMDDEKLIAYKISRFNVSRNNSASEYSRLIIATVGNVLKIISLGFCISRIIYPIKKIADYTNLSELLIKKIVATASLLSGGAALVKYVVDIYAKSELKPRPSHPAFAA